MCEHCHRHLRRSKSLKEIREELVPQIRQEMHGWLVASERIQVADDATLGHAIFQHQELLAQASGWAQCISLLNQLL